MSFSNLPVFLQGVIAVCVETVTAVTNPATKTPAGGIVEVCTAGENGAYITEIFAEPTASCAANSLSVWIQPAGGTNKFIVAQATAAAQTINATTGAKAVSLGVTEDDHIKLGPGDKLFVGILTANPTTTGWHWRIGGRSF